MDHLWALFVKMRRGLATPSCLRHEHVLLRLHLHRLARNSLKFSVDLREDYLSWLSDLHRFKFAGICILGVTIIVNFSGRIKEFGAIIYLLEEADICQRVQSVGLGLASTLLGDGALLATPCFMDRVEVRSECVDVSRMTSPLKVGTAQSSYPATFQ